MGPYVGSSIADAATGVAAMPPELLPFGLARL